MDLVYSTWVKNNAAPDAVALSVSDWSFFRCFCDARARIRACCGCFSVRSAGEEARHPVEQGSIHGPGAGNGTPEPADRFGRAIHELHPAPDYAMVPDLWFGELLLCPGEYASDRGIGRLSRCRLLARNPGKKVERTGTCHTPTGKRSPLIPAICDCAHSRLRRRGTSTVGKLYFSYHDRAMNTRRGRARLPVVEN